jgi:ABC-type molybdate transport system substrate-binding protein
VSAVEHCQREYVVKHRDGAEARYPEFDLRFKVDSGPQGPAPGIPVLVVSARVGDRATVIAASPDELRRLLRDACPPAATAAPGPLRLHAAGSLRAALGDVARAFERAHGIAVETHFGASGLLRQRLEGGEPAGVFASANMEHPLALARAGRAGPVVRFARNELCALARAGLPVSPETVLDRLLDPDVTLGTSTPGADPAGDYAWEVFRKAEAMRPGARARLEAKARPLTGGPASPPPPPDRSPYAALLAQGAADLFLTYCTNAASAVREVPGLQAVPLPPPLRVGADYGLTVVRGAPPEAALALALFILSPDGQAILVRHGFAARLAGGP